MSPDALLEHVWALASAGSRFLLGAGVAESSSLRVLAAAYVYAMFVATGLIAMALLHHAVRFYWVMRGTIEDSALAIGKGILVLGLLFGLIFPVTPNAPTLRWLGLPNMIATDPYVISMGVTAGRRGDVAARINQTRMPTFWWLIYISYRASMESAGRLAARSLQKSAEVARTLAQASEGELWKLAVKATTGIDIDDRCRQENFQSVEEMFRDPFCYAALNWLQNTDLSWWERLYQSNRPATRTITRRINHYRESFMEKARSIQDSLRTKADFLNGIARGTTPSEGLGTIPGGGTGTYTPAFLALPISATIGSEFRDLFNEFTASQTRLFAQALWEAAKNEAPDLVAWLNGYCAEHPDDPNLCYSGEGWKDLGITAGKVAAGAAATALVGGGAYKLAKGSLALARTTGILRNLASVGRKLGGKFADQASSLISKMPGLGTSLRLLGGIGAKFVGLPAAAHYFFTHGGARKIWDAALLITFLLVYFSFILALMGMAIVFSIMLPAMGIFRGSAELVRFGMALGGIASVPIFTVFGFWLLVAIRDLYVAHVVPLVTWVFQEGLGAGFGFMGSAVEVLATPIVWSFEIFLHLAAVLGICGLLFWFAFKAYRNLAGHMADAPSIKVNMPWAKG